MPNLQETEETKDYVGKNLLRNHQYMPGAHKKGRTGVSFYFVCAYFTRIQFGINRNTNTHKCICYMFIKLQNIHDTIVRMSEYSLI